MKAVRGARGDNVVMLHPILRKLAIGAAVIYVIYMAGIFYLTQDSPAEGAFKEALGIHSSNWQTYFIAVPIAVLGLLYILARGGIIGKRRSPR
jgi:hypothetical protein